MFSPRTAKPIAFGFEVPGAITDQWKSFGHEQVIAQAEMLPIVVIKRQFVNLVGSARVIFFIDNEGVKEAFVSGTTKSVASRKMLVEAMMRDSEQQLIVVRTCSITK